MSDKKQSKRQKMRLFIKRIAKKFPFMTNSGKMHVHVYQEPSQPSESPSSTSKTDTSTAQNPNTEQRQKIIQQKPNQITEVASTEPSISSTHSGDGIFTQKLIIDPEPTPNPNCYKFTLNTNIGRSFSCSPKEIQRIILVLLYCN